MSPIRYTLRYALPYKGYIALNIAFNLLYAIFNALSFIALWPMLEVLFGGEKTPAKQPKYEGIGDALNYALASIRFTVCLLYTSHAADDMQ